MSSTKFILVDDEPDVKEIYEVFISNILGRDFLFEFFLNGKECMDYLESNYNKDESYFIITDINMPVMDGFTLLKNLREQYSDIEVALCSAYDSADYKSKGRDLGASRFIAKPVDFEEVATLIEKRLDGVAS